MELTNLEGLDEICDVCNKYKRYALFSNSLVRQLLLRPRETTSFTTHAVEWCGARPRFDFVFGTTFPFGPRVPARPTRPVLCLPGYLHSPPSLTRRLTRGKHLPCVWHCERRHVTQDAADERTLPMHLPVTILRDVLLRWTASSHPKSRWLVWRCRVGQRRSGRSFSITRPADGPCTPPNPEARSSSLAAWPARRHRDAANLSSWTGPQRTGQCCRSPGIRQIIFISSWYHSTT